MLGTDVLVIQTLRFFRAIRQNALAFVAEREIDGSRNLLPHGGMAFDLFPDGIHGRVGPQKPIRELFIFPEQTQQQVFRFNVRAAELAGFVPGKEDDTPGLLRVSLKHLV